MNEEITVAPPSHESSLGWYRIRCGIFVIVALLAVFVLPRFVPVSPSISDSYLFGYNNQIGVLLLLGFLMVGAAGSKDPGIKFSPSSNTGNNIPRKIILLWMAVFTASGAVMYWRVHGLQGLQESEYLIDRVKMLAAGHRPYRDFEFAYGAVFLYGPRALMLLHLTAENSYFVFWLSCLLASVWLLSRTLNMLDYPRCQRVEIFHLLCLLALPMVLCTGVNYTLLRYLPASYLGLLVQRVDGRKERWHRELAISMSLAFTILLLLISPEMALAYVPGTAIYFAVFTKWELKSTASYGAFLLIELSILFTADRLDVFETLKAFGGGAFNLPIIPAAHILFFFFNCALVALFVSARIRKGSQGDGMLMVVAVSIGTLFAALGKCDIGHLALSGIGIIIVAMMIASTFSRLWKGYRIAFLAIFVLVPGLFAIAASDAAQQGAVGRVAREVDLCNTLAQENDTMLAPFGNNPNCGTKSDSPIIDSGYFYGMINALSPATVRRKIDELQNHPERKLLLPEGFNGMCSVNVELQRQYIQLVSIYPFHWKAKHEDSVTEPLCIYVRDNYHATTNLIENGYRFAIWSPNTPSIP
jgi:hypothetical protein